ncbi:MAG TPA: hypothetical protein VGG16_27000 [Streptosporangiaceae bacterium]
MPDVVTPELAAAALASDAMIAALRLASWIGSRAPVTPRGWLSPGPALEACAALGIELPPGKVRLRSMGDVPSLARAWETAVAAGLILVNPSNARGIGFRLVEADPSLDMDTAVLTAWLRAIAAPLVLPDYECAQWLAAVTVLAAAGDEGFTAAQVRDAVFAAGEERDAGARTDEWLEDWAWFGAVTGRGFSGGELAVGGLPAGGLAVDDLLAGGRYDVTPLGRLFADTVTGTLAPAPDQDAAAVIEGLGSLPVSLTVRFLTQWLAARTTADAAGELIDFAAAATPYQRATAIDLAAELGPDAAPAWRERADLPGYGAYVREWLVDQGEPVAGVPGDQAWMAAEMFALALLEQPPPWITVARKTPWAMEEAFGTSDAVTVLSESAHPDAARLIGIVQEAKVQDQ